VVSVRTQVVAGIKYYIDFYAANAAGKVFLYIFYEYLLLVLLFIITLFLLLFLLMHSECKQILSIFCGCLP